MLRLETETGWWLITHQDHAHLACDFAAAWGNEHFRKPEPRDRVLFAIASHDDGWAAKDAHPSITREGKPSAFSSELIGTRSSLDEVDLADYLAVREQAVRTVAEQDPYAGALVAIHTRDLLVNHIDRSTLAPEDLPLLDRFLEQQTVWRLQLLNWIRNHPMLDEKEKEATTIREHFRLLQACDHLSILACLDHDSSSGLLHPLPLNDGGKQEVQVLPLGPRHFQLAPWPFTEPELVFTVPARHVASHHFEDSAALETAFVTASVKILSVTLTAPAQS